MTARHKPYQRNRQKYLSGYAEPEITLATHITHKCYQHVLVIPVYKESPDVIERIVAPIKNESLLVILIVNQPDTVSNTQANQALWNIVLSHYQSINHSHSHQLLSISDNIDLLMIDRFTQEKIPHKQGVGLARKIGGDIACQLIQQQKLNTDWIHYSDADTHLPSNYFADLDNATGNTQEHISAAVYAYKHIPSGNAPLDDATQRYEQALAYYVNGLKKAGSPYAYHTLGSCIATHANDYCMARGFPKKAGGEDFYLLNKLAKLGKVITLENTVLGIESRHSDRVPFGTGPAVEKILAMDNPDQEYLYYHPQCFTELSALLTHFSLLFDYKKESQAYAHWLKQLSKPLQAALTTLQIERLFAHIDKQINNNEQCIAHCHQWLDGFKTLKLIHLLEADYPKQPLSHNNIGHNN